MGSRAVVAIARDEAAVLRRFGVAGEGRGIVYTRTGRRFFNEPDLEKRVLDRLGEALSAAGFWEEFQTDWFILDCELMPWSLKAKELLTRQYGAVGAASKAMLRPALEWIAAAETRGLDVSALRDRYTERARDAQRFVDAYRRCCWHVHSLDDIRLAPFHLLASEGKVHADRTHVWHMETLHRLSRHGDGFLLATPFRIIDLSDDAARAGLEDWWLGLTDEGGEGIVVKPVDFIPKLSGKPVQPALKCRGRDYLRIIYGPEYTQPANLQRLRRRALSGKRALAVREFALGLEALERFVAGEPLRRVHECVFGVLALESEPVDPRL